MVIMEELPSPSVAAAAAAAEAVAAAAAAAAALLPLLLLAAAGSADGVAVAAGGVGGIAPWNCVRDGDGGGGHGSRQGTRHIAWSRSTTYAKKKQEKQGKKRGRCQNI